MELTETTFLDATKKDRAFLKELKRAAVAAKQYNLASELRQMELEFFVEPDKYAEEFKNAIFLKKALEMAGIGIDEKMAFVTKEVFKHAAKMKGKFDIDTVSKIKAEADKIFGE